MMSSDDMKKTIRRDKLLGMWAPAKLGITGREAAAYSDALAVGSLDPERSDVFTKNSQGLRCRRGWFKGTKRSYES
jgi:hypothetical protein